MARKNAIRAQAADEVHPVLDVESRLTEDNHQSLKLWLRMLSCTTMIEAEIRSRLRLEFGITLPRFDLMAQLERHPEGLRMGELSKRLMVTGGSVTGITDQLEQEGLVVRDAVPDDRRAYSVSLTPSGRRAFNRMASRHEGWITELMKGLDAQERDTLFTLLSTLKRGLAAAAQPDH
ncbi:MarR family winged helix-turn-helix transcriptional regulator [Massilia sp. CMS3.1]|uniref:MarR family winged helix-turn-helix transcriptional regulator n=1 Tax=Massilia sp. CMS3.1 TaxID=3373083 RepID=UPI003EE66733